MKLTSRFNHSNIGAVAELIDVSCYVNESWFPTIQNELYAAWTDADFNDFSIQEIIDFVHFIDPPQNLAQHYFVENPITDSGVSPKWDFTSSGKFKGNADAFVIAKGNGTLSSPNDPKDDVTWLEVLQVKGDVADEVFRFDTVGGQPPVNVSNLVMIRGVYDTHLLHPVLTRPKPGRLDQIHLEIQ